jgi:hypothetical protein
VWRRQAYQEAVTYERPGSPHYHGKMVSFLMLLGLTDQRAERFEEARVAYSHALHHLAYLPPGADRDRRQAVVREKLQEVEEVSPAVAVAVAVAPPPAADGEVRRVVMVMVCPASFRQPTPLVPVSGFAGFRQSQPAGRLDPGGWRG